MKNAISFGTDGVRGRVGIHPFNPDGLRVFGAAIAEWALEKYQKISPRVLIGYDSRISGTEIKQDLIDVLTHFEIEVVDARVLTTPAIYRLISIDTSFDFGIAISASHNPFQDNGIKLFDAKKCKLERDDEVKIETLFDYYFKKQSLLNFVIVGQAVIWENAKQRYTASLIQYFKPNFLSGLTIVLDCANGAASDIAPHIFEKLGANVIKIGALPDGKNINRDCGSLHPKLLQKSVLYAKADIGFAFDGDADRLLVVSKIGQIKDGDDVLMLLLGNPNYSSTKTLVSTITANQGLESELKKLGKNLIRTQVGDKFVAAALDENNLLLGGETSGHVIMKDYMPTGDGIFVALKLLEAVILNKNWDLKTFEKYPQVSINIPVKNKRDLTQKPYSEIIQKCRESIQDGRIVVRYSGTENLLRILTEASTDAMANSVAKNLANFLQEALSN
ncbi:MAG: Phosphoglucosamine mutase [candidate division TM6 bacterium GW2011_GWF2_37_49]|nr:MAG: Phosphoglucosamine mutase [candidate division TM6 bacterium GW2011_GWF2_37_49]